ncbi:unnamed protein product [Phaeothamnion confervicola]
MQVVVMCRDVRPAKLLEHLHVMTAPAALSVEAAASVAAAEAAATTELTAGAATGMTLVRVRAAGAAGSPGPVAAGPAARVHQPSAVIFLPGGSQRLGNVFGCKTMAAFAIRGEPADSGGAALPAMEGNSDGGGTNDQSTIVPQQKSPAGTDSSAAAALRRVDSIAAFLRQKAQTA